MISATPRVACLVLIFAFATSGFAQDEIDADSGTWIDGGETLVVVPASRKIIAAYSVPKATWDRVELASPLAKEVNVVVSGQLAAFRTDTAVYVFSAATATWDRVELASPLAKEVNVALSGRLAAFQSGTAIYAFGAATATWSRLKLSDDSKARFVIDSHGPRSRQRCPLHLRG